MSYIVVDRNNNVIGIVFFGTGYQNQNGSWVLSNTQSFSEEQQQIILQAILQQFRRLSVYEIISVLLLFINVVVFYYF